MGKSSRTQRLRSWLAGKLFLLAGRLDEAYDVWLDHAPRRNECICHSDTFHHPDCRAHAYRGGSLDRPTA